MKGGHLTMSKKERDKLMACKEVIKGHQSRTEAAQLLGITVRHMRRIIKRFAAYGAAGLIHMSRGRPSNRRMEEDFRRQVIELCRKDYEGYGPTFAAEKLAARGIIVNKETLRLWLIQDGQWVRQRKRGSHRKRRPRKEHFGELVLIDGSDHRWFGPNGEEYCLLVMVDDATGIMLALMSNKETTQAAMELLKEWIIRYGVPQALYSDKRNIYVLDRQPTYNERLRGISEPKTAFGMACAQLGIRIIPSHSPQARGRIEKMNRTLQDRLLKDFVSAGIKTIDKANEFMRAGWIDAFNAKFAKPPAQSEDFHRPMPEETDLNEIFCHEDERVVYKDWVVRCHNKCYQILKNNDPLPAPRAKVIVRQCLDGTIRILYKEHNLAHKAIIDPVPDKTSISSLYKLLDPHERTAANE
jgi:transposase-like protein